MGGNSGKTRESNADEGAREPGANERTEGTDELDVMDVAVGRGAGGADDGLDIIGRDSTLDQKCDESVCAVMGSGRGRERGRGACRARGVVK